VRNFYAVPPIRSKPAPSPNHRRSLRELVRRNPHGLVKENPQQQMKQIGDLNFAIRSDPERCAHSASVFHLHHDDAGRFASERRVACSSRWVSAIRRVRDGARGGDVTCVAAALIGLALAMGLFPYASKFVAGLAMP